MEIKSGGDILNLAICYTLHETVVQRGREVSNLRCHPVTEIQDWDVVVVGPLVQTQVVLQRVFQLTEKTTQETKV